MKKHFFLSIRVKLAAAFLFVYLIPVIAMLYLLNSQLEGSFDKIAIPRLNSAVSAISADFENKKASTSGQVEALCGDRHIIEAAALYDKFPADLSHEVQTLAANTHLDFVRIVDFDGKILASYPAPADFNEIVTDTNIRRAFQESTGPLEIAVEKNFKDKNTPTLSINAYCAIKYLDTPSAVLTGGSFIDKNYLRQLYLLSNAHMKLFQGENLIGSFPSEGESAPTDSILLEKFRLNPQHTETLSFQGKEYMIGALPVAAGPAAKPAALFVLDVSREQVNTVLKTTRRYVLIIAALGLGVSFIIGIILSLGITRPISALARSARLIGRGRFLEAHNSVKARDELGILAEAMNKMIADLKEYHEKLAMSERVAAWREIARRIAHEIKNPLSPIQLSMENMKEAFTENPQEFNRMFPECADTVLEEVDKLRRLANEFSEFARLPKPQFEKVDIVEVLENVVNLHAANQSSVRTTFTADTGRPLFVRADRDQLNRVFTNLIKNALEAMPAGGDLKIIVRHLNDEIFIVIEDSGEGIDREDMQKIFTPYYTTKKTGSGLGLAIVQRIIKDHDASIDLYSEKGAGTKFILAFRELDERSSGGSSNG